MLQEFERYIVQHHMLDKEDKLVIAVSGGPDSVCLLHLMSRMAQSWALTIHVAHLHHGMRGSIADEDLRFVDEFASRLGCHFHSQEVDVPVLATQRGKGIEEAGRFARYRFFAQLCNDLGTRTVALGHHADDQAETVLQRILRGTGPDGLAGIYPVRNVSELRLIRPLLSFSRQQIESYIAQYDLPTRFDQTNLQMEFTRNRLRYELIPQLMASYNTRLPEALTKIAEIAQAENHYFEQLLDEMTAEVVDRFGLVSYSASRLRNCHIALGRRLVRRLLSTSASNDQQGTDYFHVNHLLEMLAQTNRNSWQMAIPGGQVVVLSQERVYFLPPQQLVVEPWQQSFVVPGSLLLPWTRSRLMATIVQRPAQGWRGKPYLSCTLIGKELLVRNRRPGDILSLEQGRKKISDLFIDHKLPAPWRDRIPIVTLGDDLILVGDIRAATSFSPKPYDLEAILITIEPIPYIQQEASNEQ